MKCVETLVCYPMPMIYQKVWTKKKCRFYKGCWQSSNKEKKKKKTVWIIVGLTCWLGNMIALTPSLFMVQPYVFENLIATLLSFVVFLLTCRRSVKWISQNRNMNRVLWVMFCSPRSGLQTKLSAIYSFWIRLCPSLKRNLDWKSPRSRLFDENPSSR